jgi:hypothetical protein
VLNKKGETAQPGGTQEIFGVSRSLMILLAFFLLFGSYIIFGFIDRGDFFEKQVTANRIGVNIDGLQLFDGNVRMLDYVHWNNTYSVNYSDGRVRVYDDSGGQNYFFARDGNLIHQYEHYNDSRALLYLKQGEHFSIATDTSSFNQYTLDCRGSRTSLTQVHLNAQLPGITQNNSLLVNSLLTRFSSFDAGLYKTSTPVATAGVTLSSVVTLTTGTQESDQNIVKAYVSSDPAKLSNSRLLACTILNEVSSDLIKNKRLLTGVAIIPVWEESIESDSPLGVLKKSNIGVVLELGNDQHLTPDWALSFFQSIDAGINKYGVEHIVG